jgi:hypothetical protein
MRVLSRVVAVVALFAAGSMQAQESSLPAVAANSADSALAAAPLVAPLELSPISFADRPVVGASRFSISAPDAPDFGAAAMQDSTSGIKGFLFGTQRRKSNTFIVGGIATSLIGVGVIKGHGGAIIGVGGLLMSIYGFYLMF